MESNYGPNSIDEPNLLYKLQHKTVVFNTKEKLSNRGYNLVASSSKYGIVFVAVPDGTLSVYTLKQLISHENQHVNVKLQECATHIAVSCDHELLAVAGLQALYVYKVTDFQNQNVAPSVSMKTNVNPSTFVSALQWNPCIPDSLALAFHDGTLVVCQVTTNQVKKVQTKARCICWSPKGKQLVTGNNDGTLCQYKPDLALAKTVPAPKLPEGSSIEALAVYWISTFQFAVVYKSISDDSRPSVTIVNAGKTGQPTCLNYEDVCFSMGSVRPWYYFLLGLAQWNIILASSSNSMEIATMASTDGANWTQWCQTDEARPELPLTDRKSENYPVGIAIDTCAIHQLPWGENEVLPFMPTLLVVSQTGLLTIFNIVNLDKGAAQICTPPQPFTLPASTLTSVIPGESPAGSAPIAAPVPIIQPKPQVIQQVPALQPMQPQPVNQAQPVPAVSNFAQAQPPPSAFGSSNVIKVPKPQFTSMFGSAALNQSDQTAPDVKPSVPQQPSEFLQPVVQTKPVQPQPKPAVVPTQQSSQIQENAALKEEQERINKMKANQELKNMLVKEVNDFQMELYKFLVKTQETQAKLQRDIETISANFNFTSLDSEQLKKDCSLEDLRGAIIQLKLELVRTCALVAEARTHAGTKDLQQWTQADPLTTKRVASVKKLAYYVQNQLEQAQKALDFKWNEIVANNPSAKPGKYMIRPKLDDVYQPLVKQQEILSRQQIVLRNLRNALKECDIMPLGKSTSLLRSTPFRNKDPLSKLTKNILNMSIEAETKTKKPLLTPQKYDALRDMLSNHKTVKIKPVDIEMRHHLATMRSKYEKAMQEKNQVGSAENFANKKVQVKIEPKASVPMNIKIEPKIEPKQTEIAPPFSPIVKPTTMPGLQKVTRTLFTEPTTSENFKTKNPVESFNFSSAAYASNPSFHQISKNDSNHFMGQKICSPTAFSNQPTTTESALLKPLASENVSSQPKAFEPKAVNATALKSSETGELERTAKLADSKNISKPTAYTFGTPHSSFSNVPDVLKTHQGMPSADAKTTSKQAESKPEKAIVKVGNQPEKAKENMPEKAIELTKVIPKTVEKENIPKTFVPQIVKPSPLSPLSQSTATASKSADSTTTPIVQKPEVKQPESNPSSLIALLSAPSKPADTITKPIVQKPEVKKDESSTKAFGVTTASTASIFGTAVTSQSKTTSTSIFSSSTTQSFVFGDSKGSTIATSASESIKPIVLSAPTPATSVFDTVTITSTSSTSESATTTTSAFSSAPAFSTSATTQSTSTTSSIFGSNATTTQASAFGTPSTTAGVFTPTTSSQPLFGTATTTTQSLFGSVTSNTQASSIFGVAASQTFGATTTQPSVFATTTTTTPAAVFGSTTQQTSIFGAPAQSTPASVFGSQTTQQSIFGSSSQTTTTQASVFGGTTPTTPASVFGSTTPTTQASAFGGTTTTQASVFGGGATPTTQASVFGGTTPTTQTSVFGSTTSTTQASVFGGTPPTTQASVFGGTTTTQASVFGGTTPTTQPSVFGSATPTKPVFGTSAQASVFGSPTQTTQTSVFGTPTQTTQASIFGTPTSTAQPSLFGTPTTTTQSGSLFGEAGANLFASATISTTSASTPATGGNIFGGSSGSVFGNSSPNVFGGNSSFGQSNSNASSIFGSRTSFGQTPAPNLWGSGTNATTGFGSSSFGQPATTQASSIFGNASAGSFSSPQTGQPFGSTQQTSPFGATEAKPSVFGSPQQPTSGFGGSAVFGSKPAFGQSAGFGSPTSSGFGSFGGFNKSPTSGFGAPASFGGGSVFGGTPAFGNTSPGKVFGGMSTPMAGFGSTQSNSTFENLATQNTLTFGNLAQQSGQPTQSAPSFNTSPSFTGWRG